MKFASKKQTKPNLLYNPTKKAVGNTIADSLFVFGDIRENVCGDNRRGRGVAG